MASGVRGFSGAVLRQRRLREGLTADDLAAILEVSESAITAWERGLSAPTPSNLKRLAEALRLHTSDLLAGRTGPPFLADLRILAGLTLADAAIATGLSRSTLGRFERGSHPIGVDVRAQLAAAYDSDEEAVQAAWQRSADRRTARRNARRAE